MVVKVEHPNGYFGILYGKSSMMIYDRNGNEVIHTGFRNINTKEELYEHLGKIPELSRAYENMRRNEKIGSGTAGRKGGTCTSI